MEIPTNATLQGDTIMSAQPTAERQRFDLAIEGMTCSACSARLERILNAAEGIGRAAVNLASERAVIHTDPALADLDKVIATVRSCGFDVGTESGAFHVDDLAAGPAAEHIAHALRTVPGVLDVRIEPALERVDVTVVSLMVPDSVLIGAAREVGHRLVPEADGTGRAEREQLQTLRERRAILAAAVLAAPFLVQMGLMFLGDGAAHLRMPAWVELVLAVPLQFGFGARFYRGAANSLRGGTANMDVLVVLGTTAAFAFSVHQMIAFGAGAHLYFEASAFIITLVMVGKHLEARAKRGTAAAIRELLDLQPDTALVRAPDGSLAERRSRDLVPGDVVVCRPGDRIPTDGEIVRGEAEVDESLVTGESSPVPKEAGDPVAAGAINVDGHIDIRTTAVGEDSTLARMIRLVENAQAGKPAVQRLVDKVSAVFVPVVICFAALTFLGTWLAAGSGLEAAVVAAAATLVIACPCALGLATPTAIMTGSGAAARAGILIRDITTLEHAHGLTHIVFDKTGTLTEGRPALADIELLADLDENEVLRIAASLQQGSEHPIAAAFREEARRRGLDLAEVGNFRSMVSRGIGGFVEGTRYLVGNDRLFREGNLDPPTPGTHRGGTDVWLGGNDGLLARFELVDRLRPDAKAAVEELKSLHITPLLVSGDAVPVVRNIADELGIERVHGEARPEDKAAIIAEIAEAGGKVGMVGDGINDAPALARATVGIALGSGTGIAMETASITLMRPDPRLVAGAVDASRRIFRKIRQNLFWAFVYNAVGLPLAALGHLSPSLAGAAMAFSSVSVIANSLTLRAWKPRLAGPAAEPAVR